MLVLILIAVAIVLPIILKKRGVRTRFRWLIPAVIFGFLGGSVVGYLLGPTYGISGMTGEPVRVHLSLANVLTSGAYTRSANLQVMAAEAFRILMGWAVGLGVSGGSAGYFAGRAQESRRRGGQQQAAQQQADARSSI